MEAGIEYGASLRTWRDYFPNAQIWGIDNLYSLHKHFTDEGLNEQAVNQKINDTLKDLAESERVHLLICDQMDKDFIYEAIGETQFDLAIDDGMHTSPSHQKCFRFLFPKVISGGYYIVEDLAYCPSDINDPRAFTPTWLNSMQEGKFFSFYIPEDEGLTLMDQIEFISVIGELAIIRKK
jgi:hypothetical protein